MNKEQAAEAFVKHTYGDNYEPKHKSKRYISFLAGWEACLAALSPTDAVGTMLKTIDEAIRARQAGNISFDDLQKKMSEAVELFHPSGAAPQTKSKHEILQGYLKDVKCSEDAYPGIMAAMEEFAQQERGSPTPTSSRASMGEHGTKVPR